MKKVKKPKPLTKANILKEVNNLANGFMDDYIKGNKQREEFVDQVMDYADPKNGLIEDWSNLYSYVDGYLTKFPLN